MTKQTLLAHLEGPASVAYTFMPVSRVIELINGLEETPPPSALTEADIQELANNIAEGIASQGMDIIGDYDLSMSYKEVELDSVDFNENDIAREVEKTIKDFFNDRAERDID